MQKCVNCGEPLKNGGKCEVCGYENVSEVLNSKPDIVANIQSNPIDIIEQCKKSIVKIIVEYVDSLSEGTGWCGYDNYIITNAHVIFGKNPNNIKCEFFNENENKTRLMLMEPIYISIIEDIAILVPLDDKLPNDVKVLPINTDDVKMGEQVFTIGNPLHYKWTYMNGAVANPSYKGREDAKSKYGYLQTTLTLNHGNSGGPVFNYKGEVVGMATFSETTLESEKQIDPVAIFEGRNPIAEKAIVKAIEGYGFCVKSVTIVDAIKSAKYMRGEK